MHFPIEQEENRSSFTASNGGDRPKNKKLNQKLKTKKDTSLLNQYIHRSAQNLKL